MKEEQEDDVGESDDIEGAEAVELEVEPPSKSKASRDATVDEGTMAPFVRTPHWLVVSIGMVPFAVITRKIPEEPRTRRT